MSPEIGCARRRPLAFALLPFLFTAGVLAQDAPPPPADASGSPPLTIRRAAGEIVVDGKLGDPGWEGASRVDTWFETNPGDSVEPKVPHVGWLAYDDRFFYAAFEFADPEPGKIRAPYAERDNVPSTTDYGGVIIDTRNDRKSAQMFLANPRGIQYDALTNDAAGEDSSPDFFWDSEASITDKGWILELRIPFSSLRYDGDADPQTWGILLYRNWPRDFRYQMFSAKLPRGGNCFICRRNDLTGLEGLPRGGHVVAAPFLAASQLSLPEAGLGTPLEDGDAEAEPGLDVKWIPDPDLALDATLNPDFSQVESDAAQIAANERFALFFPEKRPFFLEGIDLFSTNFRAVHTRSITAPRWGARATGKWGDTAYTALVAEDRGGGLVIIPGRQESSFALQDFESLVGVARVRHDLGDSYLSFLATAREIDGGGSNRVYGPDFRWQPNASDTVSGQFLLAESQTPERPDLAAEWDGRRLSGYATDLWWSHSTTAVDWFRRVHRRRRRVPRRQRLPAAGRLPHRLRRSGLHLPPHRLPPPRAHLPHRHLHRGPRRRPAQQPGLARGGDRRPLELLHALPLRLRRGGERRRDLRARAVPLPDRCQPVAADQLRLALRQRRRGDRLPALAPRRRRHGVPARDGQRHRPPGAAPQRRPPLARRARRGRPAAGGSSPPTSGACAPPIPSRRARTCV